MVSFETKAALLMRDDRCYVARLAADDERIRTVFAPSTTVAHEINWFSHPRR